MGNGGWEQVAVLTEGTEPLDVHVQKQGFALCLTDISFTFILNIILGLLSLGENELSHSKDHVF